MKYNILPNSEIVKPIAPKAGYLIPNTELGKIMAKQLTEQYPSLKVIDYGFYLEITECQLNKEILN